MNGAGWYRYGLVTYVAGDEMIDLAGSTVELVRRVKNGRSILDVIDRRTGEVLIVIELEN